MADQNSNSSSQAQVLQQLTALTDAIQAHRAQVASAEATLSSSPPAAPVNPAAHADTNALMQQFLQARMAEMYPAGTPSIPPVVPAPPPVVPAPPPVVPAPPPFAPVEPVEVVEQEPEAPEEATDSLETRFADLERRMGDALQGISNRLLEMTNGIDARLRVIEDDDGGDSRPTSPTAAESVKCSADENQCEETSCAAPINAEPLTDEEMAATEWPVRPGTPLQLVQDVTPTEPTSKARAPKGAEGSHPDGQPKPRRRRKKKAREKPDTS